MKLPVIVPLVCEPVLLALNVDAWFKLAMNTYNGIGVAVVLCSCKQIQPYRLDHWVVYNLKKINIERPIEWYALSKP